MATDFNRCTVPELRRYLQQRLVASSKYNRRKLIELAKYAEELKLEVLDENDYRDMCEERRKIEMKDGEVKYAIDIADIKQWCSDLKELPEISTGDIMIFLLHTCQWSEDRLKHYKNDNGYKLFVANHVSDVEIYKTQLGYTYVRGRCIPETRQSSDPYITWTLVENSGFVKSGGCTCVADDGSCKHVVALLFACNSFCNRHIDRHTLVGTDQLCYWDKPKKESKPSKVNDLQYYNEKTDLKHTYTPMKQKESHISKRDLEVEVYNLCRGSSAGFLQMIDPPSDASEDEENIDSFETILRANLGKENILEILRNKHDSDYVNAIEQNTVGQSQNPEWYLHRKFRITASQAHKIVHCHIDNLNENHYLVKEFFGTSISFSTKATKYGCQMETIAKNQYFENFKITHQKSRMIDCGLFVSKENPFMAASPDGITQCKCCGTRLMEVKCSYKYQDKTPYEIANLTSYHIHLVDGSIKLKKTSPWYYQIQMQLGVSKKEKCDFIFFTLKGIFVETINYDSDVYLEIVNKSAKFFEIVFNKFMH